MVKELTLEVKLTLRRQTKTIDKVRWKILRTDWNRPQHYPFAIRTLVITQKEWSSYQSEILDMLRAALPTHTHITITEVK